MTISVQTENQDGSDTRWLGQLGQVMNWRHTITFPGGPSSAQFDFAAPFNLQHPALAPGRRLYAYSGCAVVWAGRLEQPRRGQPWACTATGIAALAKEFAAYDPTNIYGNLNAVVDALILAGLPWTRPASLTGPVGAALRYTDTLDGVLGTLVTQGGYWNLTPAGVITTPSGPAGVSLMAFASDVPGGRSFDNYGNVVIGTYSNSGAGGATAYVNTSPTSAAVTRYGRFDKRIDLTGLGSMTTTAAQNAVNAILARYAQGPAWTDTLTLNGGQVFTMGGAQPDLATIQAGITVRVMATNPDTFGSGASLVDIPIGQVDYDDVSNTIQLTPLVSARDDFTSTLTKAGV